MVDAIDQGCQREQEDRERAIAAQRAHAPMPPVGFCYNCGEVLFVGCFCDPDCRDDYELLERSRELNYGGQYARR